MQIRRIIFPIILVLVSIYISFANYVLGTYLSGWDTIHPEFDFALYFKRILSVWQEHQGLGAVAAQAHASELPRLILYYLTSFLLPNSFLRYFQFFICLILGPLGVYFFTKEFIAVKFNKISGEVISFLAGLYYLLNLATLQQFVVPLEMFAIHFATLGWIFLFATKYLKNGLKKNLYLFIFSIFFSIPIAHTPTLFYVFFVCFSFYILLYKFLNRLNIKKAVALLAIILTLNSYWLLPNIYYIVNYGESVTFSKIHSQFTDRAIDVVRNFGNLKDTAELKNFLFVWGRFDFNKHDYVYLLKGWQEHLKSPIINSIGILIFFISTFGLIYAVAKKDKESISLLPIFAIPIFFILNDNFIYQNLFNFLQNNSPVIRESLRFTFTKFSILLAFAYCLYFAYGLGYFLERFIKPQNQKRFSIILLIIFSFLIIVFMKPVFTGKLISSSMKVNIPKSYFQMFDYFREVNPTERIALFPIHTFWGWTYYKWGYEGAGFLWFGLRQPLLNREFDRWMPTNENFYWEVSYAVYSKNPKLLENVLEKYKVVYLLIDPNVIDTVSNRSTLIEELKNTFENSPKIKFVNEFGKLRLYKYALTKHPKDFIKVSSSLPNVGPKYFNSNIDLGFAENKDYQTKSGGQDVYYPFRSLFTNTKGKNEFQILETENAFIFLQDLPENIKDYKLKDINGIKEIAVTNEQNPEIQTTISPTVSLNEKQIKVSIPKISNLITKDINPLLKIYKKSKNCDYLSLDLTGRYKKVDLKKIFDGEKEILRASSIIANNCTLSIPLEGLDHKNSYIFSLESRNITGKPFLFWLENLESRRNDLETYLPINSNFVKNYFIQPPMDAYGKGYILHLDNWSFNKKPSINELSNISAYNLPYEYLTRIAYEKKTQNFTQKKDCSYESQQVNLYLYKVNLKNCTSVQTLSLYQSFDKGWIAFQFRNAEIDILEHILINNWANGWNFKSEKNTTIIIYYWPQTLMYIGFGLILIMMIILSFKRRD